MSPWRPASSHPSRRCSSSGSSTPEMPSCWKPSSRPQSLMRVARAAKSVGAVIRLYIMPYMSVLPENLYVASQVRELDRRAIEDAGIAAATLMQRAGEAAWTQLKHQWPGAQNILVLCGAGSNAGDGYVLALQALKQQHRVTVLTLGDRLK